MSQNTVIIEKELTKYQVAYIYGDVLKVLEKVTDDRNFPNLSYATRQLLREYFQHLGITNPEEAKNND